MKAGPQWVSPLLPAQSLAQMTTTKAFNIYSKYHITLSKSLNLLVPPFPICKMELRRRCFIELYWGLCELIYIKHFRDVPGTRKALRGCFLPALRQSPKPVTSALAPCYEVPDSTGESEGDGPAQQRRKLTACRKMIPTFQFQALPP